MPRCYCRLVLALLVIVFAWWHVSWASIALTVLGGLLALMALRGGGCCCAAKCQTSETQPQSEQKPAN